jgi:hypothetical protein
MHLTTTSRHRFTGHSSWTAMSRHWSWTRASGEELGRHRDYRGQEYVELGAEIAVDGHLDPRIIGDAARTGLHDQQALKKV